MSDQKKRIIAQFTAQAGRFDDARYPLSSKELLEWAVGELPLKAGDTVLDVAAGTGLLSLAISSYVHKVLAMDITPAMLDAGRLSAKSSGISNGDFQLGDAYELAAAEEYDVVMTRLSFHHFEHPQAVLANMVRAAKMGGRVAVLDIISPGDDEEAENYNHIERLRDDSHTRALTSEELETMFKAAGLSDVRLQQRCVLNDAQAWMEMTDTPNENSVLIKNMLDQDVADGKKTGFQPFYSDEGRLKFYHQWLMISGVKMD